jgi:hypothetical protein
VVTARSVQDWFKFIQENDDDNIVRELLLLFATPEEQRKKDHQQVLNLITALRLDQMARENS